jgi:NAD(P)-dependent dehydrogenase (short-subunit alcohol dehydrogenase family)
MSLAKRHALVTGSTSGIGLAIARALAKEGADVVINGFGDKAAIETERANIAKEFGVKAFYNGADMAKAPEIGAMIADAQSKMGSLDILVSNAGIQRVGLVGKLSFADWSSVVATHLNGFFLCASQAVTRMAARGKGGAIVSIASTAAFVGLPGRGAYCAAKAGILGLTRALALEVASAGIRVNAVAPGFTRTKLIDQGLADGSLQEDWMVARVPMKRLAATQEIANAVRYLAGDEASYVTGQTLIVDGGWTVQGIPHAPSWLQTPADG